MAAFHWACVGHNTMLMSSALISQSSVVTVSTYDLETGENGGNSGNRENEKNGENGGKGLEERARWVRMKILE